MSNLNAFLHPVNTVDKQEVIVSDRFCDENEKLIRLSTRRVNVRGQKVERLDNGEYGRRVVVAATVTPDFRSEEMCKAYGTMDPLEVPGKMLLVGEFNRLSDAILALSGLDDDPEELAKN